MLVRIDAERRNLKTAMEVTRDALRANPGNETLEGFERELEAARTR